jgi:hypothetical protein
MFKFCCFGGAGTLALKFKNTYLLVTWSVVSSPPGRRVAETSW